MIYIYFNDKYIIILYIAYLYYNTYNIKYNILIYLLLKLINKFDVTFLNISNCKIK